MSAYGIHHVSAITKDIIENHDFFTQFLGHRLVKKTVNQDSPDMYHLFYSDYKGTPGTDVTFLKSAWPRNLRREQIPSPVLFFVYLQSKPLNTSEHVWKNKVFIMKASSITSEKQ
ncbi:VOC family protein [Jeotgalicoccus sp. WY2]|uniref:VOC family protein n=1 Tax=Jeotgalicoccus sp. WY2 TaxID=2708346 RepID=UPI0020219BA5|nr:VOC family protein [Jeotgalicoccus sp. WY2]